jgi:outer membrane protein
MITPNRLLLIAALGVLLVGSSIHPAPAFGQASELPQPIVGVVDWDLVMNESKAGKSARGQLEKQAAAFKEEYKKQRKAFDASEAKLQAQQKSLSDAELKQKVDELNAQGAKIEKALSQQDKALDANYKKAREQIGTALTGVVSDIAKKRGLTLVLKKSDVVVFAQEYDITDDAMKQLDAKLPSIKLQASN